MSFLMKFFVDIYQDLIYGARWSRWAIRPIFKSMDLLVIRISNVIFAKKFHGRLTRLLALESVGPDGKAVPFAMLFLLKFSWMSVNTLAIELAGLDRSFLPKYFMDVRQDLSCGAGRTQQENRPIFKIFNLFSAEIFLGRRSKPWLWSRLVQTVKTLDMEPIGLDRQMAHCQGQMIPRVVHESFGDLDFRCRFLPKYFLDILQDLSYEISWSRRANRPIFKVKRAPEKVNPTFGQFSCAIVNGSFDDPYVRRHLCRKILWTSVKTLAMEPVGPN
ncbi:hypothetical protein H5410_056436 [Solanum commersonii]|uniref:Uncharacterized protein n=1 Tax=Solanum commersonii TaxID=4109 RepID=A0A9J5WN28_SOLCO|nr:hypothetical protein H5410_056436 [Solanum commersonii]